MDLHTALDCASAQFAGTLSRVHHGQWQAATPDPDWSVRDLVNHVVGGNLRYVALLSGAPTAQVEALRDADHLGDDPWRAFQVTATEVTRAFHQPGAMQATCHHRHGDRSGRELLVMRVVEHPLHGWDLARAIGHDDRLDPEVVSAILAATESDPHWFERAGFTPFESPAAGDPQRELLCRSGRPG